MNEPAACREGLKSIGARAHDSESLSLALIEVGAHSCQLVGLGGNTTALEVVWPGGELKCWVQCDDGGEGVRAPERDATDLCVGWISAEDEAESRGPDWYVCPNDIEAADAIAETPYRLGLLDDAPYRRTACPHLSNDHGPIGDARCEIRGCACPAPTRGATPP